MKIFAVILTLTACLLVLGCDDDKETIAGVDSSKKFTDLTTEEIKDLCRFDFEERGAASNEDVCMSNAVLLLGLGEEACEEAYEQCLEEMGGPPTAETTCGDIKKEDYLDMNCDATVGELYDSDCFADLRAEGEKIRKDYSCDMNPEDVGVDEFPLPDSCEELKKTCPDMLPV